LFSRIKLDAILVIISVWTLALFYLYLIVESHSIEHYVIKFDSDLQVGGFLWLLGFPPTIKLTTTI